MKYRYITTLLFIVLVAACKKDDKNDPNNNGNNNGNGAEYGTGSNAITINIGDEKPYTIKGVNELEAEYNIRSSMYEYSLNNWIAIHADGNLPIELKIVAREYPKTSNAIGRYYIDQGSHVGSEIGGKGRIFTLDSGRVDITSIEQAGNKMAKVKGNFSMWVSAKANGTSEKMVITGTLDLNDTEYTIP